MDLLENLVRENLSTGRSIIDYINQHQENIIFNGKNISGKMSHEEIKLLRTKMQMIFQDPMACLNPRKKSIRYYRRRS